jgi:hypothetical protein
MSTTRHHCIQLLGLFLFDATRDSRTQPDWHIINSGEPGAARPEYFCRRCTAVPYMTASSRTILRTSTLTLADQLAEAKKTNPPERAYQEASRQVNCQLPIKKVPEDGPGLPRSADQHPVIHPWLSPPLVRFSPSITSSPFLSPSRPAPLRLGRVQPRLSSDRLATQAGTGLGA